MDSNASVAGQQTTATRHNQNARSLTSGRPSAPAQSHHPSESTSSRAALNPNTKTSKPPSTSRFSLGNLSNLRKPQPAVFWNDKKSIDQGQQRTFYNDVTPPPSPSYAGGDDKNSMSIGYPSFGKTPPVGEERGTTATTAGEGYDYRYDYVAPQAPIPKRGMFDGMSKRKFWAIIIAIAVILVLALAIGLGVGLGTKGGGSGEGDSDESNEHGDSERTGDSNDPIETTTTTVLADPTSTFSSLPDSPTTTQRSTVCPAANDTSFDVPNSSKSFRRRCGIDYPSSSGTEDIAIVWTASVQDCMIYCAGYDGCAACAWGVLPGDNYKDNHRCYLKKNLGEKEDARDGWDFAFLEE